VVNTLRFHRVWVALTRMWFIGGIWHLIYNFSHPQKRVGASRPSDETCLMLKVDFRNCFCRKWRRTMCLYRRLSSTSFVGRVSAWPIDFWVTTMHSWVTIRFRLRSEHCWHVFKWTPPSRHMSSSSVNQSTQSWLWCRSSVGNRFESNQHRVSSHSSIHINNLNG